MKFEHVDNQELLTLEDRTEVSAVAEALRIHYGMLSRESGTTDEQLLSVEARLRVLGGVTLMASEGKHVAYTFMDELSTDIVRASLESATNPPQQDPMMDIVLRGAASDLESLSNI